MNPFRRSRKLEHDLGIDTHEVDGYVPASVKAPEWQRFMQIGPDDLDVSEQDAAFLASLAASAAIDAPPSRMRETPGPAPMQHPRTADRIPGRMTLASDAPLDAPAPAPDRDDLRVFRELAHHQSAESVLARLHVPDAELPELIDDLETLRAALQQRKAA